MKKVNTLKSLEFLVILFLYIVLLLLPNKSIPIYLQENKISPLSHQLTMDAH